MNTNIKGLTEEEVLEARRKHGSNSLEKMKKRSLFRRFIDNLSDPIIKILLIALGLEVLFTFGNCNILEVLGIVSAILIATLVSTFSEYGSEAAFDKMEREASADTARVIRSGKILNIPTDEIVVGDVMTVSRGEMIYADASLIKGEITVDQSALNGENIDVSKSKGEWNSDLASHTSVFRGSLVTSGEAVVRVMAVGNKTYYGMVAKDVQVETRESPLRIRLEGLAKVISRIGYAVAILVGISFLFSAFLVDNGFVYENIVNSFKDKRFLLSTLVKALTLMITIVVVAVPEGLPMMITVVLTANMKRMIRDKILVKKLVGIETSGSINLLFTDKTGTLTSGQLSVDRIISYRSVYKSKKALMSSGKIFDTVCLSAFYNTDCQLSESGEPVGGNSTDKAFLTYFKGEIYPHLSVLSRSEFNSERKYSSVTFENKRKIVKGAPEIIFSMTGSVLSEGGDRIVSDLAFLKREYRKAVSRGERVIAIAEGSEASGFSLVCLAVLKDSLRDGVIDAVKQVMGAGIKIVMVTGDNKDTAVSIAEECGIYSSLNGDIALSSDELSQLTDEDVKKALPRLSVVARALPQDKTRLVRLAQEMNLVVGMTGDGINDAPSLKLADVGFSMGSGTDIAKSAGDIVILDDSFGAICKAILYGRTIFKSIKKFITFQLIMNLAACGITLLGRFFGIDTPITIIQMLWVNIIMDTLGGIAFSGEAPMNYYMKEKPKTREEPILSREVVSKVILNGGFTLLLLILFLTHGFFRSFFPDPRRHLTAFYALFIFSGLFNCFASRSDRLFIFHGILKNKLFISVLAFISMVQILIIYFGGAIFRSTPLLFSELLLVILFSFTVLIFDGVRRFFAKLK